jgi:hypothetical protein
MERIVVTYLKKGTGIRMEEFIKCILVSLAKIRKGRLHKLPSQDLPVKPSHCREKNEITKKENRLPEIKRNNVKGFLVASCFYQLLYMMLSFEIT